MLECVRRIRQGYIRLRMALINQTRGLLAEYGAIMRQEARQARCNECLTPLIASTQKKPRNAFTFRGIAPLTATVRMRCREACLSYAGMTRAVEQ